MQSVQTSDLGTKTTPHGALHSLGTNQQKNKLQYNLAGVLLLKYVPFLQNHLLGLIHIPIGEQIEVQHEDLSIPQVHPSPGESSVGSHHFPRPYHIYHMFLMLNYSVHPTLSNNSSPSPANHEQLRSPAANGETPWLFAISP